MKNLFDYATKELSQDAFLAWLISSAKQNDEIDKESEKAGRAFLERVAHIDKKIKINDIKVIQQYKKIDVMAIIYLEGGEKIGLFIEDKVFYVEHDDQLIKYNKIIDDLDKKKEHFTRVEKCYFKPFYLDKEERKRVKAAGWDEFSNPNHHTPYVKWFFSKLIKMKNIILKQYGEHINDIYYKALNKKLPTKSNDFPLCWKGFFFITVSPELEKDFDCSVVVSYSSASLKITPKFMKNKYIPTLTINSLDSSNNCVVARVSLAHMKFNDRLPYNTNLLLLNKNIFRINQIKIKKQKVGAISRNKMCKYKDEKEFIQIVKKLAYEYRKMFTPKLKK